MASEGTIHNDDSLVHAVGRVGALVRALQCPLKHAHQLLEDALAVDFNGPVGRLQHLCPNSGILVAKRAPLNEELEEGVELGLGKMGRQLPVGAREAVAAFPRVRQVHLLGHAILVELLDPWLRKLHIRVIELLEDPIERGNVGADCLRQ